MTRTAIPAEAFDHGDARRYRRGCRCQPCVRAVTKDGQRVRYLNATGRSCTTTPDRAADHIATLRAAGTPDTYTRQAAQICDDALYRIVRREGLIHRTTETRVLSVRPLTGGIRVGTRVPALGTIRRLRALAADGWPAAELARRCGKHTQFIVFLQGSPETGKVRMWVADYVSVLYGQLQGRKPEAEGVPRHIAEQARSRAAAKEWTGSAWWDDDEVENPDYQPATARTARYIALAEDCLELERQELTREQIAERLGVTRDGLQRALSEYRKKTDMRKAA